MGTVRCTATSRKTVTIASRQKKSRPSRKQERARDSSPIHALGVQDSTHDWIVDSGLPVISAIPRHCLTSLNPCLNPRRALGDGRTLEAMGVGAVKVKLMESLGLED